MACGVLVVSDRYSDHLPPDAACAWSMYMVSADGAPVGDDLAPSVMSHDATYGGTLQQHLQPGSLLPSSRYRVVVVVSMPWSRGVLRAPATLGLVTATCPTGGSVSVVPGAGVAGVTKCVSGRPMSSNMKCNMKCAEQCLVCCCLLTPCILRDLTCVSSDFP